MKPPVANRRAALTLLEIVIASTLLTALVGAVAVVLRGAHAAWLAHEGDVKQLEAAQATLRHLVRSIRQAQSVVAISAAGVSPGTLSLAMPSGQTLVWAYSGGVINTGVSTANQLLAEGIAALSFSAYKADGVTPATVVGDIQLIKCQVQVNLPRDVGGARTISAWAWLRSW